MTQFDEALHLEVLWQQFRRQHGIGDGRIHRVKFLNTLLLQSEQWHEEQERRKIKVVSY